MSLFGSKPAFGSTATPSTSSAFTFGAPATSTSTPAKPLFGSVSQPSSTSLFGSTTATTSAPSTGLFGAPAAKSTGLFGTPASSAPASGGLFGSTATSTGGGGLFSKPATGFGASTGGSLFGAKPAGGLFGGTTAAAGQPAPEARQRDTLYGIMTNADAMVHSLTCPELYGDERDRIIGKLNQVAAALGVGSGFYKDGQSVQYTQEGPFHRLKAIGYNTVSQYTDEDGIVALVLQTPSTELQSSPQRQKVIDTLFAVLGNQTNLQPKIKAVKPLPDGKTEVLIYVVNKTSGTPATSSALTQVLSEAAKKQQLETQMKVIKISSCTAMNKFQRERYFREPPAGFDDSVWAQACAENPDKERLIPCPIRGFEELLDRQKAQANEVSIENKLLEVFSNRLTSMKTRGESAAVKMEQQKIWNKQLSHRVLRVVAMQLLQQRFGHGIDSTEEQIQCALETLNARMNAPQQIKPRIAEMLDLIREEGSVLRKHVADAPNFTLSEGDMQLVNRYLARCQDGLESLSTLVRDNLKQLNNFSNAIGI